MNFFDKILSTFLVLEYYSVTNAVMWSLNLVQVTESISGSVVPLAMFHLATPEVDVLTPHGYARRKPLSLDF